MLTGIAAAFFYLFSFVLIASAIMVILARNPVHSVLFLILAFFNAAALFLLANAEFLSMILLVVYVGAVAVLFLFVVMMLDTDLKQAKRNLLQHARFGAVIAVIFLVELIAMIYSRYLAKLTPAIDQFNSENSAYDISFDSVSSSDLVGSSVSNQINNLLFARVLHNYFQQVRWLKIVHPSGH